VMWHKGVWPPVLSTSQVVLHKLLGVPCMHGMLALDQAEYRVVGGTCVHSKVCSIARTVHYTIISIARQRGVLLPAWRSWRC
jgi:hypothetical protein